MTNWRTEYCASQPSELEVIGRNLYIQRRDITEVSHISEEDSSEYTNWECESREISFDEYNLLKDIEQINTDKAIEDYTMELIEEGVL